MSLISFCPYWATTSPRNGEGEPCRAGSASKIRMVLTSALVGWVCIASRGQQLGHCLLSQWHVCGGDAGVGVPWSIPLRGRSAGS